MNRIAIVKLFLLVCVTLVTAQFSRNNDTESETENGHKKIAKKIQSNDTETMVIIKDTVNIGEEFFDNIDFAKIVRLSYKGDTKNFLSVIRFIEKFGTSRQKLEEVLYEEMIRSGHEDTQEHVMFGVFIKKLLTEARKSSDQERIQNLESVKDRLPPGIRHLCFSNAIFFNNGDKDIDLLYVGLENEALGYPSGYKAIAIDGGRFFQFEKAGGENKGEFLYAGNEVGYSTPSYGPLEQNDAFYWRIKPTEKGKYFQVINEARNYSMDTVLRWECSDSHEAVERCSWYRISYHLLKSAQETPQNVIIEEASKDN